MKHLPQNSSFKSLSFCRKLTFSWKKWGRGEEWKEKRGKENE